MHIILLGDPYQDPEVKYDIAVQLLKHCYPDAKFTSIKVNEALDNIDTINNADIILIQITDVWMTPMMELFKSNKLSRSPKYIAHASEITDNYNVISDYNYYNEYTRKDLNRCVQGGIPSYLDAIIAPSKNEIFGIKNIWYPYLFTPTLWSEDFHKDIVKLIKSNPKIDKNLSSHENDICMCYKFESTHRNRIADKFESAGHKIKYSGKWRHNDDSLGPREPGYSMIKKYYPKFKFSLAVENDYHPTYISEKVFDPLIAGIVPIYYDPLNQFPHDFLNKDACVIINSVLDIPSLELDSHRYEGKYIFSQNALSMYEEWYSTMMDIIKGL
jgi:hypothetical protein